VMLLAGLFGAVLSASASLAREIRSGTALAVLSKPVGRAQFLLAKYVVLALVVAYLLGGFSNFFLRRPFVSDAVFGVVLTVTLAFVVINFFDKNGRSQEFARGVDWRMVPASVLVLFALWVLAGLALACSTRLEMIPTLAICSGVFLLGLMSQYLFGART